MGLLDNTYIPELELFGDRYEIQTYQHVGSDVLYNLTPNYVGLEPVVGKSPRSRSFSVEKQKMLKLISAIVLSSVKVANTSELTEDAKSLIVKVVNILYPQVTSSIKFEMCHHWGKLYWNVTGVLNDKRLTIWGIGINEMQYGKLPPFKRNKGNKITCMRKVERLREL